MFVPDGWPGDVTLIWLSPIPGLGELDEAHALLATAAHSRVVLVTVVQTPGVLELTKYALRLNAVIIRAGIPEKALEPLIRDALEMRRPLRVPRIRVPLVAHEELLKVVMSIPNEHTEVISQVLDLWDFAKGLLRKLDETAVQGLLQLEEPEEPEEFTEKDALRWFESCPTSAALCVDSPREVTTSTLETSLPSDLHKILVVGSQTDDVVQWCHDHFGTTSSFKKFTGTAGRLLREGDSLRLRLLTPEMAFTSYAIGVSDIEVARTLLDMQFSMVILVDDGIEWSLFEDALHVENGDFSALEALLPPPDTKEPVVEEPPEVTTESTRGQFDDLTKEQFDELHAHSADMRAYLLATVMKPLTLAMVDLVQNPGGDPIDRVATYLEKTADQLERRAEAEAYLRFRGSVAKLNELRAMEDADDAQAELDAKARDREFRANLRQMLTPKGS